MFQRTMGIFPPAQITAFRKWLRSSENHIMFLQTCKSSILGIGIYMFPWCNEKLQEARQKGIGLFGAVHVSFSLHPTVCLWAKSPCAFQIPKRRTADSPYIVPVSKPPPSKAAPMSRLMCFLPNNVRHPVQRHCSGSPWRAYSAVLLENRTGESSRPR